MPTGVEVSLIEGSGTSQVIDEIAPLYAAAREKYEGVANVGGAYETLQWICVRFGDVTRIVLVQDQGHPLAFSLIFEVDGVMYSYITGQTYSLRARETRAFFHATYYEPIGRAIRKRMEHIDFGVLSSEAKATRGCELRPLVGFFAFGEELRQHVAEVGEITDAAWARLLKHHTGRGRRS